MKSFLVVLVLGVLFTTINYAQDKKEKGCCSTDESKTMSKICDVPDEVSNSSGDENNLVASNNDDKTKKVEKDVKAVDKNMKKDKSKSTNSEDGCCSTDKKKIEKTKVPKS
jgi:hypothetical protein